MLPDEIRNDKYVCHRRTGNRRTGNRRTGNRLRRRLSSCHSRDDIK
jgi:hypothetical protein